MIKYFGFDDVMSAESFWKDVVPSAHSITILRSNKRSDITYEKSDKGWNVIGKVGTRKVSVPVPSTRKLIDNLLFESNCGAVATIE